MGSIAEHGLASASSFQPNQGSAAALGQDMLGGGALSPPVAHGLADFGSMSGHFPLASTPQAGHAFLQTAAVSTFAGASQLLHGSQEYPTSSKRARLEVYFSLHTIFICQALNSSQKQLQTVFFFFLFFFFFWITGKMSTPCMP